MLIFVVSNPYSLRNPLVLFSFAYFLFCLFQHNSGTYHTFPVLMYSSCTLDISTFYFCIVITLLFFLRFLCMMAQATSSDKSYEEIPNEKEVSHFV